MSTSEFPGFDRIYTLQHAAVQGALRLHPIEDDLPFSDLFLGVVQPPSRIAFRLDAGRKAYDLVGTTTGILRLLSARFVATLRDVGASGWNAVPVDILPSRGTADDAAYHMLTVTGRCGPLDQRRTRIVRREAPNPRGAPWYDELGAFFDPDSWDGSDVFAPEGTAIVCVTPRVAGAITRAALTNVRLTPVREQWVATHSAYPEHRRG